MKPKPSVFLEAAERLASGKECYACNALAYVSRRRLPGSGERHDQWVNVPEVRFFLELYSIYGADTTCTGFEFDGVSKWLFSGHHPSCAPDAARQHRILAVLLAREVLLGGGL